MIKLRAIRDIWRGGICYSVIVNWKLLIACYIKGEGKRFYHTMHYSAKRGLAIACLSVCLPHCLSVRPSVTLVDCGHIGWNSSRIISPSVSLGCSLLATYTSRVYSKGNTPNFSPDWGWGAEKVAFGVHKL